MNDTLIHIGTKRHSGRYPWGSGDNPYQHEAWFMGEVRRLRDQGLSESDIAKGFDLTLQEYRNEIRLANLGEKHALRSQCIDLYKKGMTSPTQIGRELGISESSVRGYLKETADKEYESMKATVDVIRKNVDDKKYIDIGYGVASDLGVTDVKFKAAIQALKNEGYVEYKLYIPQATNPSNKTTLKVLAKPGTEFGEVSRNRGEIGLINEHFVDPHGSELHRAKPVEYISSKKVQVLDKNHGGAEKDGLIEIRRGAKGLDMGDNHYTQVRIGVDGTHFIKGVAVYADDLPPGIDIRVNSSKDFPNKLDHLKKIKTNDPNNPFGSYIKVGGQRGYLNIVKEEGDVNAWSRTLSSQFLSKQSITLAKQQLGIKKEDMTREYKEIMSLTNPVLKRHLLTQFADKCDNEAAVLKAASMPRQSSKLILPVNSLKDTEVYAPGYNTGERVVLIRHPHGGTFEIPELTVNNRNREGSKLIGNSNRDAIGINYKVAERLSGADFDGDTVILIPNNNKRVKTSPALRGLRDFDPHTQYKGYPGMKKLEGEQLQREMGVVSNLITDMTLKGASESDICKAVKYSMVVIDAEKHNLDFKAARKDCQITQLQKKWQVQDDGHGGGASTLISRAKSPVDVPERKKWNLSKNTVDPEGRKILEPTGRTYTNAQGKEVLAITRKGSTRMAEARDAKELMSVEKKAMEVVYADYANAMKAQANAARKSAISVKDTPYSKEAHKAYSEEVASLNKKVAQAKAYSPLERKAQATTGAIMRELIADNPSMMEDKDLKSKTQAMVLQDQRARYGGTRQSIEITDREWEAIQKGAVTKTTLQSVLKYTDQDKLKQKALPKETKAMTASKIALARSRLQSGYTQKEVADMLGVSVSTLDRALYG